MRIRQTILFLVSAILFSCSSETQGKKFDDSLFLYHNIQKTIDVDYNKKYTKLDSLQKRECIPDLSKKLSMEKDFPYCDLFHAFFVSKQKMLGNIQPIVLKTLADDFTTLILVNINNSKAVDFLILDQVEYCGGNDSSACERTRHSILNGNEITVYDVFRISGEKPYYSDSIVNKVTIDNNGYFKTERTDSVRIKY